MSNICVIHSCNTGDYAKNILNHIVNKVLDYENHFDYIFINNTGNELPLGLFDSSKIKICNYSNSTDNFEVNTIKFIHMLSICYPDSKFVYLHTKGISYEKDARRTNIERWTDIMLYGLVNHSSECIKMLDAVDCVGCFYTGDSSTKYGRIYPQHFSGNFWWANGSYLKQLPINDLAWKFDCEFWLFRRTPRFVNLFHTDDNLYLSTPASFIPEMDARIPKLLEIVEDPSKYNIYYGHENNLVDVTEKIPKEGNIKLFISEKDEDRNKLFGDPQPGKIKIIKINDVIFQLGDELRI